MQQHPSSAQIEAATAAFRMLADPTRLRLMWLLTSGEYDVTSLADLLETSRPLVSQHLAKLRLARIVTARQDGQRVFYRLENEHAKQLVSDAIFQAEHSLGGVPRHHHQQTGENA